MANKYIKTILAFAVTSFVHPFAKKNPLGAFYRIARWQIISRLKLENIETWIDGIKVKCRSGDTGFTGNLYYGLMEFEDMSFVMHLLDSEDTFIDVGSNLGSYSLISGGVCKSKTYSLEPSKITYDRLVENINLNNLTNVNCFNIGAGEKTGKVLFTTSKGPENHIITSPNLDTKDAVSVDIKKLDELFIEAEPTFMKIDTEGVELSVLRGATKILESDKMIGLLVEINGNSERYNEADSDILNLLLDLSYFPYHYNPLNRELIKLDSYEKKGNTLFIKNLEEASNKIKLEKNNTIWGYNV